MEPFKPAVWLLRAFLIMLFTGLVVAQTLIMPGTLAHMAREESELAYLQWPLLAFAIVELMCVQVVIVCTWRLLKMVTHDRIFINDAFAWVNGIIAAVAVAWLLLAGLFLYVVINADDPGVPVLLVGMLLTGGVVVLLMIVMRALLRQATNLRSDMEAVI